MEATEEDEDRGLVGVGAEVSAGAVELVEG